MEFLRHFQKSIKERPTQVFIVVAVIISAVAAIYGVTELTSGDIDMKNIFKTGQRQSFEPDGNYLITQGQSQDR